jgi:cephalosporin hydroxylase
VRRQDVRRGLRTLVSNPRRFWHVVRRMLRPMPREYRHWRRTCLFDWMIYHEREIALGACHWMGVPAFKNPLDAWIYQEIIWEVRPEVIVEIGSAHGGSTLYLAHLLDLIGQGEVISVDCDRSVFQASHPRIIAITGDSLAPEVVGAVARRCAGRSVLVIHDGDHARAQVLRDLMAYAPLVSLNSYCIVEDGIIDLFGPNDGIGAVREGPLVAIGQFLQASGQFAIDRSRERYLLTYNPHGFLKRVR